ncbi:MAG: GNAT family N-acetyltransferase [Dongiaceae bacterium]
MISPHQQDDMLALYDREMRAAAPMPGPAYRRERTNRVVRLVGPSAAAFDNCVLFSRLDDATADAAIRREIDHFGSRGRSFEWKLHDHDEPEDLPARLRRHGFMPEPRETVVVRQLSDIPPRGSTSAADVRKVDRPEQLADLVAVQNEAWKENHVALAEALAAELASDPTRIEILIAYDGPRPVATSWLRLHRGTSFASCWGAAVLPAWRGRGIYTALVERHASTARAGGARLLLADANADSLPVLERIGFRALIGVQGYVWRPAGSTGTPL